MRSCWVVPNADHQEQQISEYAQCTVLNGLDYGEWCEPGITMQAMMEYPAKRGYGVSGLFRAAFGKNCTGAGQAEGRSAVP